MKRHLSNLFEPENHLVAVVSSLVGLLDAKITQTTLEKEITNHPDYPSLLSMSDVLTHHEIENITAEFDLDSYKDLPTPFITQFTSGNGVTYFTVIKEINSVFVRLFDLEEHSWIKRNYTDFIKRTSGVVLLVKSKIGIKEQDYKEKILAEKKNTGLKYILTFCFPAMVFISGALAYQLIGLGFIYPFLLSLVLLAGISITVLLLLYEIDHHNPFIREICAAGKKSDCSAVLQTKAAKIFGISWSVIGFIYFSGSLLLLLILGITNHAALRILSGLNLLTIPYIFYSIFYQWKIAKQWCVLCLSIQAVLAVQLSLNLLGGWYFIQSSNSISQILIQVLSAFVIPFIFVGLLLPAWKKSNDNRHINKELQALKKDPEIFRALLIKQKPVKDTPAGLGIVLGNAHAKNAIIKVCNPYCNPCAEAHELLKELMKNDQELKMQIIFTTSPMDGDIKTAPVKHLLAIAEQKDKVVLNQALDDWYLPQQKDYETFAAKHPVNEKLNKQDAQIKAMSDWCRANEIQYTPTLFINGHQLPANYSVTDLKYVLSV